MAELIREKIKTGDAKVVRKADQKSKVWDTFGQVVLSDDTEPWLFFFLRVRFCGSGGRL